MSPTSCSVSRSILIPLCKLYVLFTGVCLSELKPTYSTKTIENRMHVDWFLWSQRLTKSSPTVISTTHKTPYICTQTQQKLNIEVVEVFLCIWFMPFIYEWWYLFGVSTWSSPMTLKWSCCRLPFHFLPEYSWIPELYDASVTHYFCRLRIVALLCLCVLLFI